MKEKSNDELASRIGDLEAFVDGLKIKASVLAIGCVIGFAIFGIVKFLDFVLGKN